MKKLVIAVIVLSVVLGGLVALQVNAQVLEVKPLPIQSELKVTEGESVIVDGKVILQPATSVQETYNPQQ